MATKKASITLLRAARKASLASRASAASTSRAAARAARSASAAAGDGARVFRLLREALIAYPPRTRSCVNRLFPNSADFQHLPEDATTPTDKDLESDEATIALYLRWCKAFNKKRDRCGVAETVYRFKIFRYNAWDVHRHNADAPADPDEAAICIEMRREARLLLSKGEDVSRFDERHLPAILGPLSDGGDPFLRECDYKLLKAIGKEPITTSTRASCASE